MLKGLPASGKSTYAKKLALDGYVRVNKDDLRSMLHSSKWSKENEKQVIRLRDQVIMDSLLQGKSVVVDDTNLAPKHTERLKQLAKEYGATFETKFFNVDVYECIKRDLKRLNSVGSKVIRDMYRDFLEPAPTLYVPPKDTPIAVICDIDGTLAHMNGRSPYDPTRYYEDTKDDTIHFIFSRISEGAVRIICSGRDETYRESTEKWLANYGITYDFLYMRPAGDKRNDTIIKQEIYDTHIKDSYNVRCVLDDRNRVVEMWRRNGLKCLQVAEGDF